MPAITMTIVAIAAPGEKHGINSIHCIRAVAGSRAIPSAITRSHTSITGSVSRAVASITISTPGKKYGVINRLRDSTIPRAIPGAIPRTVAAVASSIARAISVACECRDCHYKKCCGYQCCFCQC
ncbi:MAG: hypothetical protein V1793_07690 [Pseudomonadota bacterium]